MYPIRLDMIDSKHEDNCLMGVLISQEVTLTSKETDYVVPINCLGEFIWRKVFT